MTIHKNRHPHGKNLGEAFRALKDFERLVRLRNKNKMSVPDFKYGIELQAACVVLMFKENGGLSLRSKGEINRRLRDALQRYYRQEKEKITQQTKKERLTRALSKHFMKLMYHHANVYRAPMRHEM